MRSSAVVLGAHWSILVGCSCGRNRRRFVPETTRLIPKIMDLLLRDAVPLVYLPGTPPRNRRLRILIVSFDRWKGDSGREMGVTCC